MASSLRANKVADLIHRDLAKIIATECKDPRLGMVTISSVDLSNNLAHARVYFTILEADKKVQSTAILTKAAGFLRSALASNLTLRGVPKLQFIYDESIERGQTIDALINSVISNEIKPDK